MNRKFPLDRESVIPAQAGIQLVKTSLRSRSASKFCPLRGVFVLLDSRLRGNDGSYELLELKRFLFAFALLMNVLPAQANDWWSNLWRNADQQGEQLMQQGDASSAVKVYADPRRIAYAKLKAGDFAGAASDLSSLHDSDSDYNRGNALAQAGDLQGALDAYDAALKTNPNNQDARHNRELVAQALKQQPPQQQKSGDNQSQDEKKSGDDKSDMQSGKDQNSSGQSKNNSDKEKNSSAQNSSQQQSGSGEKSKDEKSSDGKQRGQNGNNQSKQNDQTVQGKSKDDADQAKRDAEASLAQAAQNANSGDLNSASAVSAATPKSEQQIAQEQWLRSIPDDPGGLLRRKFLIEHMIRQQKAQ